MSKFIGGMDNLTPVSIGEKGHQQYTWANKNEKKSFFQFQELINQISFQIVRTKTPGPVIKKYDDVLKELKSLLEATRDETEIAQYREYITILIKMCAQTRDIVAGKGECSLSYLMLHSIMNVYPDIGKALFRKFVLLDIDGVSVHPYGSWKDVKYICEIFRKNKNTPMDFIVRIVNEQLAKDEEAFKRGDSISLLAKWIPRESSKFGWLFFYLSTNYLSNVIASAKGKPNETKEKAVKLCKMHYRKIVSTLNKHLDTTQIKQCGENWSEIVPEKVTSVTLHRNKKAFLNVTKKGDQRSHLDDREECAENFRKFLDKALAGKAEVKGKRVGLADFTKEALTLLSRLPQTNSAAKSEVDMLNLQWKSNGKQNAILGNFVPLVDVSGSMDGDPLHAAIALGIRVAENSKLGKRVLTFSSIPKWVNLEGKDNFVDMVRELKGAEWGNTTNFARAMEMILGVIVQQKMSVEEVKEISLIIFSDMMIDQADKNYDSMYDMISKKYADAGINVHGAPYTPPHIIFWNLRSTSGFPSLTKQKNTSMLSGFSPLLLNLFCEKGMECLENYTPWEMLKEGLAHARYNVLDEIISQNI